MGGGGPAHWATGGPHDGGPVRARLERQEGGRRGPAMSGGVFQNPQNPAYGEGGEEPGVNPLVCYLCHQVGPPTD